MIELQSLSKRYGAIVALDTISLRVEKGEYVALLGPNGAGKTTIIRVLLNFTTPDSGSALLRGVPVSNPECRKKVGYLPENLKIPSFLTGREFLRRHAQLCDLKGKEQDLSIERVLELVGMKDRQKHRAGTYSKGMLQRIGLAAALLCSPELLILDEPTNGLDPIGIREFRTILERLKIEGITLLLNSHILSEVERLCTSAAIMSKGKIVAKDTVTNLLREGETLEDVFVRLVGR